MHPLDKHFNKNFSAQLLRSYVAEKGKRARKRRKDEGEKQKRDTIPYEKGLQTNLCDSSTSHANVSGVWLPFSLTTCTLLVRLPPRALRSSKGTRGVELWINTRRATLPRPTASNDRLKTACISLFNIVWNNWTFRNFLK